METNLSYTLHHPKWYRHPMSVWWWLKRWCYTRFVLRELTSVFIGFAALVFLWQLRALGRGPEAYAEFCRAMKTPLMLLLDVVTLAAAVYHAMTWFHLAPRAMDLRILGKKIPGLAVIGLNYFLWIVASFAVAWIGLGG
jgi:fumarate reductase subunit C